jgi:DNA polymerase
MSNQFAEFQNQVEIVKSRCINGEISEEERNDIIRKMSLNDESWGDVWMLSPKLEWFRKANGSKHWVHDYPLALVDADAASQPISDILDINEIALAIHNCTRCPLHSGRSRAVPGEGPEPADIMMIGEGPGFHEDKQARPFVGASGRFLEELLDRIGYKRTDVFIANVIKCRPPNNRDPQPDELTACKEFLDQQIELIDPKIIVTLGRFSMQRYFPGASISKIHGQSKRVDDRLVVPMFHPAAALRNPQWRSLIIEDFERLPALIKEVALFTNSEDAGIQLSMF